MIRKTSNRGFALPLVLVGGFLLASLVLSFHFVSASDTRSIARLTRSVQAGLLADLASDELAGQVAAISYGANDPKPQWVTDMFTELANQRTGTPPFKVKGGSPITFGLNDLPVTKAAADRSAGLLQVKSVEAKLGPFTPTGADDALIYKDEVFQDAAKDPRAWDLRGPLAVEIVVAGDRGPFDFGQRYQRGQELVITDTSPPASEFALFSFLPPPDASYAMLDMQTGGNLVINPAGADNNSSSRVHIRGPLFIMSEDAPSAPNEPHIATTMANADKVQDAPAGGKPSAYPDGQWTAGMATIPGPRTLQHTDDTGSNIDAALGGIRDAFEGAVEGLQPRRPANAVAETRLKTRPGAAIPVTVTVNVTTPAVGILGVRIVESTTISQKITIDFNVPTIDWRMLQESLVLSNNYQSDNATFETIDRDVVAYYPPGAYIYGPLPPEKHTFKMFKNLPALVPRPCYFGVKVPLGGGEPAKFDPAQKAEGDLVTTEPVPRAGNPPAANAGLIGVYGVALFESKTIVNYPIRELALWMMQKFIDTKLASAPDFVKRVARENKETAADQTLAFLRMSPTLQFLIRRFKLEGGLKYANLPTADFSSDLRDKLNAKQALIAPWGSWYHDKGFWKSQLPAPLLDEGKKALKTATVNKPADETLKVLLQEGNQPEFTPDWNAIDPSWPTGGSPGADTAAKKIRDWICGDHAQKLLRPVLGGSTGTNGATNFDALLALAKEPRGITEPTLKPGKRPKGAFGDYLAPAVAPADFAALKTDFPKGYFPSKYRDFERAVTRSYYSMENYLNAETKNGALDLKGVVLIERMEFAKPFTYRGRGIIVCGSTDQHTASLTGKVQAAADDPKACLTLVHRVSPNLLKTGKAPQIKLGDEFQGAVYSDSGVTPSSSTHIIGNLSCGLIEKNKIAAGTTLQVDYFKDRMACPPDKIAERWTVEMTGEVSSTQPSP